MYNAPNPMHITLAAGESIANIQLIWTNPDDISIRPSAIRYSYDKVNWSPIVWYNNSVTNYMSIDTSQPTIYFEGEVTSMSGPLDYDIFCHFWVDHNVEAGGNACSLLINEDIVGENALSGIFYNESSSYFKSLPDVEASTIGYNGLGLYGCATGITKTPRILATSLDSFALSYAFSDCMDLVDGSSIVIEQENLPGYCCQGLFSNCSSLEKGPTIKSKTFGPSACQHICWGCINLNTFTPIQDPSAAQNGFYRAFYNCSNLTTFPLIGQAVAQESQAFWGVCSGCTGLVDGSQLSIVGSANYDSAWKQAFYGCSSLTKAPYINFSGNNYGMSICESMFENCFSLKTLQLFNISTAATFNGNSFKNMFANTKVAISNIFDPENGYIAAWILNGSNAISTSFQNMFSNTAGPFKGTPVLNAMYYIPRLPTKRLRVNNKDVLTWNIDHQPHQFNGVNILTRKK